MKSYLAGYRCLPEGFAEVQEGIESLLACCGGSNDLWRMNT